MYFDHCDSPQELAEAINDLMKAETGRRIHLVPGQSGHVPLVDRHTDETLRQAYSEARSVAKRLCKQDKSMTPPPHDVEILPLSGLVSIGAWGRSIAAQERDGLLKAVNNATSYQSQAKDGQVKMDMPDYRDFTKVPVLKLIEYGEGHTLEFKETLEYDMRQNQHNKNLNKECLKTIAAFLNTDGGILLIGVKDNGKVTGIEQDLRYVQRKNLDGFELKLRNLIRDRFDLTPLNKVRIKFEKLETGTICRVNVDPVNRPQVVHLDKEVYLRDGNTTTKLDGMDLTNWTQQRVQN